MKGTEIRNSFLKYFEKNGHKIVHSSPLLPANDPTLLFTNAGMNQFKDVFTGAEKRDYTRAVSSQKCIRAGGKHNDLDEVGKTARHHTFFEMLGNFSFGDYFKQDAIRFAWDFLVNELKLDPQRLWFSVFEGDSEVPADDEARELWIKAGAPPERVLGFGRKDNFWQMGDTGPCGPCSEIHYYMGDSPGDPERNHAKWVNGEGDTTMEIWNLVFMQFERNEVEKGVFELTPLPAPSVDTGAGLERLSAVLQGVSTNYDTDLIKPIIDFAADLAGVEYSYDTPEGFALRVLADHARATAFAIADGILPGNEGRNYVLRKIMRRAIYHGREHLGFETLFFNQVCNFVVGLMGEAYPELITQRDFIGKMVRLEEERFGATLTVGLKKLADIFADNPNPDFVEFAKLYDTFGTPRDLIRVSLEEHGIAFEESEFEDKFSAAIEELQKTSDIGKTKQAEKINPIYAALEESGVKSIFRGYETTEIENSKVIALIRDDLRVDSLNEGDEGLIILDKTPFYAESGGQVGDVGVISGQWSVASDPATSDHRPPTTDNSAKAAVLDTFSPIAGIILHKSKVESGSIKVGDVVTASVDVEKRDATRRNHTATHLVHAALKEVLGSHVKQAGSVVAPSFLRFDFTHYQPITDSELQEIENLVNRYILKNEPVNTDVMAIEDAMRTGAVALFGEKYGSAVRVLSVGGGEFSRELCGGTHVRATGDIGSFKIVSDEAIASGVRRIRAITGFDSFNRFREDERLIDRSLQALKTQRDQLPSAIERLQEELKRTRKEIDELKMKIATGAIGGASDGDEARDVNGVKVVAKIVEGLDKGGMRHLSDTLLAKLKSGVVILARTEEEKVGFIVRVSDDLTGKIKAGAIVQQIAPIVGGRGGGKPDMAEGGGTEPGKLQDAIDASYGVIESMS
ncbi:MAG TPA: alanine--tRNA ligase [Pyrinomonadaceae bacterium]|nr:alanine--tRNA ligase [Pyrinomonadaceae bacterium]